MSKCVIGFVVALVTIASAFAVVSSTTAQNPNWLVSVRGQRFDGCPYYPSPIVCRVDSTTATRTGVGSR
jgi:hypothetical protein